MRLALARLASIAVCLVPSAQAANTWGTDLSDLWWNPNESGWGANIAHQGEVLFVTFFVYDSNSRARWYLASGLTSQGGNNRYTFSGPLYEASGPYLGGPFNTANVSLRTVGAATITATSVNQATLSYSVDGVQVTKVIERNTFRTNNLSGNYVGALIATASGCGANSGSLSDTAQFTLNHSGTNVSIAASLGTGGRCTYSGAYAQSGRMGSISGSFSCSNGAGGTFIAYEVEASYQGFFLRYDANYGGGCTETGRIGGMKL